MPTIVGTRVSYCGKEYFKSRDIGNNILFYR